jgi:hypothetical protein
VTVPAQPTDHDAAVDALYTKPLDEFIAARDAAVRQAADGGDRLGAERIKRLPKPSVAAWVINHVAREHPEEVAALADLGDELRAATADRDRGRIRALDHLRRERTEGLVRTVREAGEVGGRSISPAVLDRLTETLTAAVMDRDAAAAVRAGRLTRALQHVGFGIVDEQGEEPELVALHPVQGGADADEKAGAEKADAKKAKRSKAEPSTAAPKPDGDSEAADLAAAERAVDEASAQVDRLEARRDDIRERLRSADAAIERGQSEVERLDAELERLAAERDTASHTLDEAREAAEDARAELTAVEDDLDDAVERSAEARRRRRAARGR